MSFAQSWSLQQAVYARLVAQLSGQGPDGANVAVYDHKPGDPTRIHCRIDSFNVVQRLIKCDNTLHSFTVHIFDRPTGESAAARGQQTAKVLQQKVVAALHDWAPSVSGAGSVRHENSGPGGDDDPLTTHLMSRFSIYMTAAGTSDAMLWDSADAMFWDGSDAMLWETN